MSTGQLYGNSGLSPRLTDPGELTGYIVRRLPSILGVLLETPAHDMVERRRCHLHDARDRGRLRRDDGGDETGFRLGLEGALTGGHLIEHRTQGKDIGPSIGLEALELLGCHVLEGSENRAGFRQGLRFGGQVGQAIERWRALGCRLGQAEVEKLGSRSGEHDVAGLEVSVGNALTVGCIERRRDLLAELEYLV